MVKNKRGGTLSNYARRGMNAGRSGFTSGLESAKLLRNKAGPIISTGLASGQKALTSGLGSAKLLRNKAGPIISSGLVSSGRALKSLSNNVTQRSINAYTTFKPQFNQALKNGTKQMGNLSISASRGMGSLSNSASRGMGRAYTAGVPVLSELEKQAKQSLRSAKKQMENVYIAYQGSKPLVTLAKNRMKNAYNTYKPRINAAYKTYKPQLNAAYNKSRQFINKLRTGKTTNKNSPKIIEPVPATIEPAPKISEPAPVISETTKIEESKEELSPIDILTKRYDLALNTPGLIKEKTSDINTKGITLTNLSNHLLSTYKESLLIQCQPIAGFEVDDYTKILDGQYGNPSKIYERLGKIASENLVALTELGEMKGNYDNEKVMLNGITQGIGVSADNIFLGKVTNKYDDNVFIIKDKQNTNELIFNITGAKQENVIATQDAPNTLHKTHTELDSFSNLKYISTSGINILNVHLPSNGPADKSIEFFLETYLPSLDELKQTNDTEPLIPHLIVGDTNITPAKSKILGGIEIKEPIVSLETRDTIMKEMVAAVEKIYKGNSWALLMSSTSVNKKRNGGFLINQQANKKNVGSNEQDGSVIFINVKNIESIDPLTFNNENFGTNWRLLFNGKFYTDKVPDINPVNFLTFDTTITECLDGNSFLKDKLFIDHTPVQISYNTIKTMIPTLTTEPKWKNVVVLNAAAITCSKKNWNLKIIPCMDNIETVDKKLYESMQPIFGNSEVYKDIIGKVYGSWTISTKNLNQITPLLAKAHYDLSQLKCFQPVILGGRYTKKRKCKTKRKGKSMKHK